MKKKRAKCSRRSRYEILVWNLYVWNTCMETITNPSLSKLCRKNSNINVVGWYKMSFVVYFEFCLSRFWFGRKYPVKMAKNLPFM